MSLSKSLAFLAAFALAFGCKQVSTPKYTGDPAFDLTLAAQVGDVTKIKSLVAGGTQIDVETSSGWTALHWAASKGKVEALRLLIEQGAQIEKRNKSGSSPLMVAILAGQAESARTLVSLGAKADDKDESGRSPRDYAKALGIEL